AKNSAAKAALECYRYSADVTMIVREPEISNSVKYWIKPDLENRIKEGSIKAIFNARVTEITERSLRYVTPDGSFEIENDWVLAMTGYHPDYSFLEMLGIDFSGDPMQTPV